MHASPHHRLTVAAALTLLVAVAGCGGDSPAKGSAASSSVRVEAEGCRAAATVGMGAFIGEHLVLTVAHVVAGSSEVDVVLADGTEKEATVVAIDRGIDLAVLKVNADIPALTPGSMRPGTTGEVVVWRNGEPTTMTFSADAFVDINAADIDAGPAKLRKGYQITAAIEPGDSGAVLVAGGRAVAVVFAASQQHPDRAYATGVEAAHGLLASVGDTAVDTGACART